MNLSTAIFGLSVDETHSVVAQIDDAGFEAVWLADHAVTPLHFAPTYPYDPSGRPGYPPDTPLLDVWVMIGHLAHSFPRLLLGTGVYILPLRPPVVVAQAVRTAMELSGNRVLFGIGTGWMREEFEAMGQAFDGRGTRMDEMLDVMELLWRGEPFEYHGSHYDLSLVQQGGRPSPAPKLVFGGSTGPALRRCAGRGDGWFGPPACQVEEAVRYRRMIDRLREEAGRSEVPFRYYVRVPAGSAPDLLARYRDAGFEDLVVSLPWHPDRPTDLTEIADFVHAVADSARKLDA